MRWSFEWAQGLRHVRRTNLRTIAQVHFASLDPGPWFIQMIGGRTPDLFCHLGQLARGPRWLADNRHIRKGFPSLERVLGPICQHGTKLSKGPETLKTVCNLAGSLEKR
jgi:hypothetical protein